MCGCAAHQDARLHTCTCNCPSHAKLRRGRARGPGPVGFGGVYIPPTQPVLLIDMYGQELSRAAVHCRLAALNFEIRRAGRATSIYTINDDFLFDFDPRDLLVGDTFNVNIYTWSA